LKNRNECPAIRKGSSPLMTKRNSGLHRPSPRQRALADICEQRLFQIGHTPKPNMEAPPAGETYSIKFHSVAKSPTRFHAGHVQFCTPQSTPARP
jgi:hypothetical protein